MKFSTNNQACSPMMFVRENIKILHKHYIDLAKLESDEHLHNLIHHELEFLPPLELENDEKEMLVAGCLRVLEIIWNELWNVINLGSMIGKMTTRIIYFDHVTIANIPFRTSYS